MGERWGNYSLGHQIFHTAFYWMDIQLHNNWENEKNNHKTILK